jgi:beta-mannosidase
MATGCRPVIAASEEKDGKIKWWLCNDKLEEVKVKMTVKVQPLSGKASFLKELNVKVPANTSMVGIELPLEEMKNKLGRNAILVCDITYDEKGYDRSWWSPYIPKEIIYPKTQLELTLKNINESEGEVTIHSSNWGRVVTLDADVDFEDNYFEMLPGEIRTIKWKSKVRPFTAPIKVTCWNL